ncbi:DMT family transporter [Streptomyces sp. NPDC049590]|uniref:DMT family transporter n=1 Tax=Streptomyces sp. NPDC049590 TaxID=3154834 RepID=UPI00341444ED
MSALALSVLLSVVSALAYAGGAIAQEQVAVTSADSVPLHRPGWWGALALNGLGGALHVVALACGPLSLVQPLGALTIVFALPMAALCVGRRAGTRAWRGALMATAGLAGLLSLVGSNATHSLAAGQRLAVALVTGAAVAALAFAALTARRHPAVRSVLLATASGVAFGMSSVFTKTVAVDWTHGIDLGALPSLGVIVAFSVVGVLLSQLSYRHGGLAAPLATLTVVNPVLAAAVGVLMFGETFRHGTLGTVLALGCGVVAAGGLIMLTTERLENAGAARALGKAPAEAEPDAPSRTAPTASPTTVPTAPAAASPAVPAASAAASAPPVAAVPPAGPPCAQALPDAAGPAPVARKARPGVPRQRGAADTGVDPAARTGADRAGRSASGAGTRGAGHAGSGAGSGAEAAGSQTGSGTGTEGDGTAPPADTAPPPPHTASADAAPPLPCIPLSVRFHVPVTLPAPVALPPAPCPRQMLTPPARR